MKSAESEGKKKEPSVQPVSEPKKLAKPVPGLMDGGTVYSYALRYLSAMDSQTACALFLIQIGWLDRIYNTLGAEIGNQEAYRIGQTLSLSFRATDIVGRMGRDEFAIFISGSVTKDMAREKAELLKRTLEKTLGDKLETGENLRIGVCVATGSADFDEMYRKARLAGMENGAGGIGISELPGDTGQTQETLYHASLLDTVHILPLLETMEEGVCLMEAGETIRICYLSPAYCRLTGRDAGDGGQPLSLKELGVHPDDAASYEQAIKSAGQDGKMAVHIHRIACKDGRWKWIRSKITRIACPDQNAPVVLELSSDITDLRDKELRIREAEERLKVVMEQDSYFLWEVDVETERFRVYDCQPSEGRRTGEWKEFPEGLFQDGTVAVNSASNFRKFAKEILEGSREGSGNFIIRNRVTGSYGWNSLSYHMVFDERGAPVKAVGLSKINSLLSESRSQRRERYFLPEILRYSLAGRARVNLTQDSISELWLEGNDISGTAENIPYSRFIAIRQKEFAESEKGVKIHRWFDRSALIDAFYCGRRWLTREFRRIDKNGGIRWTSAVVNLFRNRANGEIGMQVFMRDIDLKKSWEKAVMGQIIRDPVTQLYDSNSLQKIAENLIALGADAQCGAAVIRVIGIPKGKELTEIEKEKRRSIAVALSLALGTDEILGQYQEDLFTAFFPDIGSENSLKKRLEEAFYYVRILLNDIFEMRTLRFVAGAFCRKIEDADFQVMTAYAAHLCEMGASAESDQVIFQEDDWQRQAAWGGEESHGITVLEEEMDRPLSEEEQSVAFHCVTAMLTSKSLDTSIGSVLRYIGTYYRAARVYILALSDSGKTVTMVYEWTELKKSSIQRAMSDVPLQKIPVLIRCLNGKAPVILEIPGEKSESSGAPWHYTACPLKGDRGIEGFLCIENSREHPSDVALLGTLIPYILKEQKRFAAAAGRTEISGRDSLTGMGNLRTYLDMINSLDSDAYATMGAAVIDIPNLSYINSTLGFEYGKELLSYISDTLSSVFKRAFLFRTWDTEFVVLSPNTTHEAFIGKCTRMRLLLQRRYPHKLRIGYTWSDRAFTGRELVREATAIMRCEQIPKEPSSMEDMMEQYGEQMAGETAGSKFVAYFQPQIDMRTGKLVGAEALVRRLDESGRVIPPGEFIQEMEKSGSVRELDFYMLEWTLSCMEKWRQSGLQIVPVSINFSRITFLNPTAPASVLALKSRYPSVADDFLEIEITETAGDVEASTLAHIMENFREFGIRFSLDDFGSHYSNLSIFTHVKFDEIKLDRSLIKDLPENMISQSMVRELVKICRHSGMRCIAEGVETESQREVLLKAGCSYAQGYYYDPPLPAEIFEKKYLRPIQGKETGGTGNDK